MRQELRRQLKEFMKRWIESRAPADTSVYNSVLNRYFMDQGNRGMFRAVEGDGGGLLQLSQL